MAALPSLVVNLGLNSVDFISGLTKAQYEAKKASDQIATNIKGIGEAFRGVVETLGVGLGVAGIVEWAKSINEAAVSLQHLSDQTGSSVEELSRLSNVAKLSGTSFETFQRSIDRLAAGLNGSEELSTKTAEALRYLGVNSKDPATALQQVADKLNQFADGAGKAAIARDLFGRQGVQFLSYLKDLANETDITATKTAEQTRQAEELAKTFARLQIESHAVADAFLNDVAPALDKVGGLLLAATRATGGFFAGLGAAAGINPFGNISKQITEANDKLKSYQDGLKNPTTNFLGGSDEQLNRNGIKTMEDRLAILKQIQVQQAKNDPNNYDSNDRRLNQKPLLAYTSGAGALKSAADDTKAILDGQIKAQEEAVAAEKDLLKSREQFLSAYYSQDLISIDSYYNAQNDARQEALRNELAAYDKEIAAAQDYANKIKASDPQADKKREEAANRIQDIEAKIAKANLDAITQASLLEIERTKDYQKYADQLVDLQAKVNALNGNSGASAGALFDVQNRGLNARLASEGNTAGQALQDQLKQAAIAQTYLNDVSRNYETILGAISVQQGYINLAQSTGRISQIEALQKQSELNKSMIPYLEQVADAYQKIADKSGLADDILRAQQMKLAVEQLKTQTDLLADSFNKTFGDAFASALSDLATGTKNFKQVVQDFSKSVTKSIADLASQDIASKLFGQGGAFSGAGDFLSKIFGGSTSGSGAAGIATLGSASAASASSVTIMATAAAQAAVALSAVGTASAFSGGAGSIASLFADSGGISSSLGSQFLGGLPFLAGGTDSFGGGYAVVGENGPEIVNLPRGAQVIPNEVMQQRRADKSINITQHINVMPGASTQSARQAAIGIREAVSRSARDR